jgi:hypothetical protein
MGRGSGGAGRTGGGSPRVQRAREQISRGFEQVRDSPIVDGTTVRVSRRGVNAHELLSEQGFELDQFASEASVNNFYTHPSGVSAVVRGGRPGARMQIIRFDEE